MALTGRVAKGVLGVLGVGGVGLAASLEKTVRAEMDLHPGSYPWTHTGLFQAIDTASASRGYQVYKNVCAACHSMQFLAFRQLVGVTHTEAGAKAEAARHMVQDGPNDLGEMFMRPAKLSDNYPPPYPNPEAAKVANNGAVPPDLSLMSRARHGNENYIFSLLTGYCDPPAGVVVPEGLYYNPYFLGKQIAMPPPLYNEAITYADGTPASMSQLAKDVTTFMAWTAEKPIDERKRISLKLTLFLCVLAPIIVYKYNQTWSYLRTKKYIFSTLKTK